ncbi:MAG: acyltransferase [Clostridia bacterium]|nr:acyltransferase [Clostridia bacterium]
MGLKELYKFCQHSWYGRMLVNIGKWFIARDAFHRKLKIHSKGSLRINKWVYGKNNILVVGEKACLDKVLIKIIGSNNVIHIGANTIIGERCRILLFGNNLNLTIGEDCTFSHDDEILVQENHSSVTIGDDCMFSHHINIRTSDAHPIYSLNSHKRTNTAKNITIGNHVWVTADVIIQKGTVIGNGCIVGARSIVNSNYASNSSEASSDINNIIIAGAPARIVKNNIYWKRSFDKNDG